MSAVAPWGFTIFCDDLRHEIDGKRTLVGAYAGEMNVHGAFPATLPKFGMAIAFYEPHHLILVRDWEVPVSIIMPGETFETASFRTVIPVALPETIEHIRKFNEEHIADDEPKFTRLDFNVVTSPFVIREPGFIRVRAMYKDQVIRMCALMVTAAPYILQPSSTPHIQPSPAP